MLGLSHLFWSPSDGKKPLKVNHVGHIRFSEEKKNKAVSSFSSFPPEIILLVASSCSITDMVSFSAVSKGFFNLTSADTLWLPLYNATPWASCEPWLNPKFKNPEKVSLDEWRAMHKRKTTCCWKSQYLTKARLDEERTHRTGQVLGDYQKKLENLEKKKFDETWDLQRTLEAEKKNAEEIGKLFAGVFFVFLVLFLSFFGVYVVSIDAFLYSIYSVPSKATESLAEIYASDPLFVNLRHLLSVVIPLAQYRDHKNKETLLISFLLILFSHFLFWIFVYCFKIFTFVLRYMVIGVFVFAFLTALPNQINKRLQTKYLDLIPEKYHIAKCEQTFETKKKRVNQKYDAEIVRLRAIVENLKKKEPKAQAQAQGGFPCIIS